MRRHLFRRWLARALAALMINCALCGSSALAAHHFGHTQTYDVVQGYVVQCQLPPCVTVAQPSGQSLGSAPTPSVPPPAPQSVTLQLAPAQTAVQTVQLTPAPVQVQTLQLVPAPVPIQTLQLTPAPVQVQMLQLAPAPVQIQTLQMNVQSIPAQTAAPVMILVPHHKCHWFCKH
jgi:hypothetical protein